MKPFAATPIRLKKAVFAALGETDMKHSILATIVALLSAFAWAGPNHEHSGNPCMQGPVAQFGRYVGDWKIEDEQLARDGSGWSPGTGARWTFECIGDGMAVQDHWYPNNGGYGTNLRTYNANSDTWEIVWAAKAQQGLMHITARQSDDGNIVMNVVSPEPPQPRRIIFFAPDDGGWDWAMQWSQDGGETWFDVYRIRATPWQD